jgi:hypothetical protein
MWGVTPEVVDHRKKNLQNFSFRRNMFSSRFRGPLSRVPKKIFDRKNFPLKKFLDLENFSRNVQIRVYQGRLPSAARLAVLVGCSNLGGSEPGSSSAG